MKYTFLCIVLFVVLVSCSQGQEKQMSLNGKWELLNYNFEKNSLESIGYSLEFLSDSICIQKELVDDRVYKNNYRYSITSKPCGEFERQENEEVSNFLVLRNKTKNVTKCFLISSLGKLEGDEDDNNVYLNLYSSGATSGNVFIKR